MTQTKHANTGNWEKTIKLIERKHGERFVEKDSCFEGRGYAINESVMWPQRFLVNVEKKNKKKS